MPAYAYKGFTDKGESITGALEADSLDHANALLSGRGIMPISLNESRGSAFSPDAIDEFMIGLTKITPDDLILFTKQFRTLFKAGVPILDSMRILVSQCDNKRLKKVIATMEDDILKGRSLYEAFRAHPKVFDGLYCSMIRAGETSGALTDILERLVYLMDHERKIKAEIKAAMRYPIIIMTALVGAFFFLLTFVMPKFVEIFSRAKIDIPWPTQVCMALNIFITQYWYIGLTIMVSSFVAFKMYVKTEQGRVNFDRLKLYIPLLGAVVVKSIMSRFGHIFALLQSSGVPILETFEILADTIGNAFVSKQFKTIREKLQHGHGIAGPLRSSGQFTPMLVNMVVIGEETGKIDEMMREVSSHYDDEVEYAVKQLSDAIAPLMTLGLAVVVGFFALAIFMPMWDLTKMAKQ